MSEQDFAGVWVYSERPPLLNELMGKGLEISQKLEEPLSAVVLGNGVKERSKELVALGASRVYYVDDETLASVHVDTYTDALGGLIQEFKPNVLLIGATKQGLDLAAKLAERLKTGLCTEAMRLDVDAEKRFLLMDRLVQGGNLVQTLIVKSKPQMATVPRGLYRAPPRDPNSKGEVIEAKPKINPPTTKIVETKPKPQTGVRVTDAEVIVSFGRGLRRKEDIHMVEELAQMIGGVVGCSRPIAQDLRWLPESQYIGLSGQKVNPKLYVACGISGQIQHLTGIRNSRVIVAINNDPKAPIFEFADYGIVGDMYQVLPALTESFRRLKGKS